MCAEDNDCYYGNVQQADQGDAVDSCELRGFVKSCLTFSFPSAEGTSSDEERSWNLPHTPSLRFALQAGLRN